MNTNSLNVSPVAKRLATGIRREQIIEACLRLISRQGIEALNIAAIADEIGLVPSAIYRHFSGKEEILESVNGLIGERLLGNIRRVCGATGDTVERLHLLLESHVGIVLKDNGVPRYVFSTGAQGSQSEQKLKLYQVVQLYLKRVAGLFVDGQRAGRIRPGLDPETLAYMFLGLIQPAILLRQMSDGQFDIEEQVDKAWNVFIHAVSVEGNL